MQSNPSRQRGMILMSVVLYNAIIAVLIGLLLPAVQAARESGRALEQHEETRALGASIVAEANATEQLVGLIEDALERDESAFRTLAPLVHDQIVRLKSRTDGIKRAYKDFQANRATITAPRTNAIATGSCTRGPFAASNTRRRCSSTMKATTTGRA